MIMCPYTLEDWVVLQFNRPGTHYIQKVERNKRQVEQRNPLAPPQSYNSLRQDSFIKVVVSGRRYFLFY